jgi:hypothetical protein
MNEEETARLFIDNDPQSDSMNGSYSSTSLNKKLKDIIEFKEFNMFMEEMITT